MNIILNIYMHVELTGPLDGGHEDRIPGRYGRLRDGDGIGYCRQSCVFLPTEAISFQTFGARVAFLRMLCYPIVTTDLVVAAGILRFRISVEHVGICYT